MATDSKPSPGFRVGAFLQLALPMIVSRAGLAVMGIADGVMVARYRPVEFAWLSLAEGTLGRVLDIFVTFLIGGLLLAPRLFAQGDASGARRVWMRTLPVSLGLGMAGVLLGIFGSPLLLLVGQPAELASGAGRVMSILGAGFPAALVAIAAAVYLEGIQRPRIVAVCVVVANLLNLALNWLLIGEHFGMAAMGARGSALSTTVMRYGLGLVLLALAWRSRPQSEISNSDQSDAGTQWKLSFGAAASVGAMVALSSCLIIFAGRLGVLPLAIFSAAWALAAPAGLITMGLADATGVFVAAEDGRAGKPSAGAIAWACLRLTLATIGTLALVLALAAKTFAGFYATDGGMRGLIASMLPLVALILVTDCLGFAMASSLRAIREAVWPAAIEVGAILLLVPIAAALALWLKLGIRGLFLAMLIAGILRASMLTLRFVWRTRSSDRTSTEQAVLQKTGASAPGEPLEIV